MYFDSSFDTCGDYSVATTKNYIEILNFRHFFNQFVFINEGDKILDEQLKRYINVSMVIDMEYRNTLEQWIYYNLIFRIMCKKPNFHTGNLVSYIV